MYFMKCIKCSGSSHAPPSTTAVKMGKEPLCKKSVAVWWFSFIFSDRLQLIVTKWLPRAWGCRTLTTTFDRKVIAQGWSISGNPAETWYSWRTGSLLSAVVIVKYAFCPNVNFCLCSKQQIFNDWSQLKRLLAIATLTPFDCRLMAG